MNRVEHFAQAPTLLLLAAACAGQSAKPASAIVTESSRSGHVQPSVSGSLLQPHTIETDDFALPLPDGYADVSTAVQLEAPRRAVVLRARTSAYGYPATIVVRKVPLAGGSFDDPSTCARTGRGLVTGGTEAPGTGGDLLSAAIIDGPVGRTCQVHLRSTQGVALITELHMPGNTPQTPKDVWLMTCNYADGDESAEATCKTALTGFRFRITLRDAVH